LVILHPKVSHKRKASDSAALKFAQKATEQRGSANRTYRNMLVYLAADEDRLAELDTATRDYLGWKHVLDNDADLDLTQNQKNQATQRQTQADQTVNARLLQTFTWALVPAQPDPKAPFVLKETKVEGQTSSLADRVSRRLGNDGDLSTRQAAATIRFAISKVPTIWEKGHVALGDLWSLYSTYPYMPRLRDRKVLNEGIVDQPMLWSADGFALATGYDEDAKRYVGLWTSDDKGFPPQPADSLLIVRPDVATAQRAVEAAAVPETGLTPTPRPEPDPQPDAGRIPPEPYKLVKHRFFGAKTLRPDHIAQDFKTIADEVLSQLRMDVSTNLNVRIEIEAISDEGFGEGRVRAVSENAKTLKFEQADFEED